MHCLHSKYNFIRSAARALFAAALFGSPFFVSCRTNVIEKQTRPVLGTVCTIQLFEYGTPKRYNRIFERLEQIEEHMSANLENSDIARVNQTAGISAVSVHEDTLEVITAALAVAEKSGGAFNPASGPLVKLWNIGSDSPHLPSEQEINAVLPLCDWKKVRVDKNKVFLLQKGMALDLGGIAKGYAADEIARIIREEHIPRAIIDLGGNIYAVGEKKDKSMWHIGIKDPFAPADQPAAVVDVKNVSVVTSGIYERFFERGGKRYHHLLDCASGRPADNGLMSVTIVHSSSMQADALATAVFVMGKEKGAAFLKQYGIAGLYIDDKKNIGVGEQLKAHFTVLNETFKTK